MTSRNADLEAEAERLARIASTLKGLARARGYSLDLAGTVAARDGLVDEDDWELLRRIFRATGADIAPDR